MKHLILLVIFLSCTLLSTAQTKVFKTYEDYRDGKGEEMETEYADYTINALGQVLKFKTKEGNQVKYKTDEIWGFLFKGKFFRSVGKRDLAMLMDSGKVNFFMNGFAAMHSIIHDGTKEIIVVKDAVSCFISVGDLNAKIYRMPIDNYTRLDYKDFKNDFPDLESLQDCFKFKGSTYEIPKNIRECVQEYNAINRKKKK